MSELSTQQIEQLFSAMETNPKLQSRMNALLGIKGPEKEHPTPLVSGPPPIASGSTTANDFNAGKSAAKDLDPADVDAVKKQDVEDPSDILAFLPDFSLPRHVSHQENAYVPNLNGMYAMIHEMNLLVAQKFRASRAHQAFDPHLVIYFYTFLANLQVARCLKFANQFDVASDITHLDTFLARFPSEKFPIPGPLLPYFKAITTYKVQNALHSRVSPRFPKYYLRQENANRWNDSDCSQLFPYLPAVLAHYTRILPIIVGGHAPVLSNASAPANAAVPTTVSPALQWADPAAHAATDLVQAVTILGVTVPEQAANAWTRNQISLVVNPAHYRIPMYTDTLAAKAAPYLAQVTLPAAPGQANSLPNYLGISDPRWIKTVLRYMSEYSALWKGSGSLADASPDGPAFGAHVSKYTALPAGSPALAAPAIVDRAHGVNHLPILEYHQAAHAFDLISQTRTTQGTSEPLVERLSAITQIHAKLADNHWDVSTSVDTRRFGNVWSIAPLYGPSSHVYFYDTVEDYVEKNLQDKLKQ